ncbi:MAG TPA: DUF4233 domain-containing protein [Streptosporangiaceae bacterium]
MTLPGQSQDAAPAPHTYDKQVYEKSLRRLCGTVLTMEAIVIALAISPAIVLEHVHGAVAGSVGGGLAVLALLLGGMVGRPRMGWALVAGTILQVLVIAAGVTLPAMYALGAIFGALWITGIWLARRIALQQA